MNYGQEALREQDPFQAYYCVMKALEARGFSQLSKGERMFLLCSRLIGQVCNGGFDQYFFNGGVEYVYETARALEKIGAAKAAKLVGQAVATANVPDPIIGGYDYYKEATDDVRKRLDALDQQFYAENLDEREIYPCLVRYLREHTDEFS